MNKIALNSNDDKKNTINRFSKIVCIQNKQRSRMQERRKQYKNMKKLNWLQISNHPYKILITRSTGSGKTNTILILIKQQSYDDYSITDKIYLYVKDLFEVKYQYLIKKRKNIGLTKLKHLKALIEFSNNIQDVYKSIKEQSPRRKCDALIIFDDMIAGRISNKKVSPIVT